MITTLRQAKVVQQRRVRAGKPGVAKAVRRFLLREYGALHGKPTNSLQALPPKRKEEKKKKKTHVPTGTKQLEAT
jgi:hypothetical protein